MPKSNLIAAVEKISEKVAKKILRDCKAFGTMGTWIKALQDDNRMLKRQVKELEIRVKKLNTYGPTPPDPVKGKRKGPGMNATSSPAQKRKMTPTQMKKIRTDHGFSQSQFALLLGIKSSRYANWENGRSNVPPEFEKKIREIQDLKASELRTRMHDVGVFQPNGKTALQKRKNGSSPRSSSSNHTQTGNKRRSDAADISDQDISYLSAAELKEVRQYLGLTQRQLALLLGIKCNRYANWECGLAKAAPVFVKKIMEFRNMPEPERETMMRNALTEALNANKIKNGKPHRKTGKK
jgi:DNA-binding transcriptional regulator YiaG